jgi:hypothetical protein
MTEDEVLLHAEHLMQAPSLDTYDYDRIVRILTVASYVADLCIKELEDRGQLEIRHGMPCIPDARPESLDVPTILTREP